MTPFERPLSKLSENHSNWMHGIQVMTAVPEPLIKQGGLVERLSTATCITSVPSNQ